jgi:hypothetical protein
MRTFIESSFGSLAAVIGDTGRVNDAVPFLHVLERFFREVEHGKNIGLKRPLNDVKIKLSDVFHGMLLRRVVDENINWLF